MLLHEAIRLRARRLASDASRGWKMEGVEKGVQPRGCSLCLPKVGYGLSGYAARRVPSHSANLGAGARSH